MPGSIFPVKTITTSFTRPSDTTAYAAGDVVCNSTSSPTIMTFDDAGFLNAGAGKVVSAELISSANQSTKGDFDLFLFDTTVAMDNDNAAFTPSDTEMATCIGVINFYGSTAIAGDATSGAGGNVVYPSPVIEIPYKCGSSSDSLFGILVARNGYTPVSAEVFTVRLAVQQDYVF